LLHPFVFSLLYFAAVSLLPAPLQAQTKSASDAVVYFAPLPLNTPEWNALRSQPLVEQLQKTLNRPVAPKLFNTLEEIVQAFENNQVDFVELSPLMYLQMLQQIPKTTPLVSIRQGAPNQAHRCVLATAIDGPDSLAELNDTPQTRVALTHALSTCGHFMVSRLLQQENKSLSQMQTHLLGHHENVALALIRQEYTLGGLAQSVAERYRDLGLKILATSAPLPVCDCRQRPDPVKRTAASHANRVAVLPAARRSLGYRHPWL
jgi:phosphonate transport system substrate-binding protein